MGNFLVDFFYRSCYYPPCFTRNILVPGGESETKNRGGDKCKATAKVAAACETLTPIGARARLFPPGFRPGRMSTKKICFGSKLL